MNILYALNAELLKLRRSKILLVTIALFIFIPLIMSLLMYLSQKPELSSKLGIIETKVRIFSTDNWLGYFEMLNQIIASLGIIGFGFVTAWIFGREYMQNTITDILSLPVSRPSIVIAKLLTAASWCLLLIFVMFVAAIFTGRMVHISGWSFDIFKKGLEMYSLTSLLTLILIPVVAFITSISRGIIAPFGFVIMVLVIAQFVVALGFGAYFPWSVAGIYTVSSNEPGMQIVPASYIILIVTSALGIFATIFWSVYANQK